MFWLRRWLWSWLRWLRIARLFLLFCVPAFLLLPVVLLLLPALYSRMVSFVARFAVDGDFESGWMILLRLLPASSTFTFAAALSSSLSFSFATAFAFSFAFVFAFAGE